MAPRTPQRLPRSHPRSTARKKRSGASPSKRPVAKTLPGWLWLVAGLGLGMLITSLVKLSAIPEPGAQPLVLPSPGSPRPEARPEPRAPAEPARTETRFDFYTLLPEREVIVPDQREVPTTAPRPQPKSQAPATTPQPQAPTASEERYLLQAGSFRRHAEADRRRAQLLLLGLEARIEPVQANGDTWYRVHAGPFMSQARVSQARELLSSEGIDTLLLKQRPAG